MDVLFNILTSMGQGILSFFADFAVFYVNFVNPVLWVLGNLLLGYTSIVLMLFIVAYFVIFDPRATTGGRLIFQFMLSLAGVIALVFIGIYIDPSNDRSWAIIPPTVEWWRPVLRFAVYGFVAYSISSLAVLLVMRKWFPHNLKKASDLHLVRPRHTSEIPVVYPVTKPIPTVKNKSEK